MDNPVKKKINVFGKIGKIITMIVIVLLLIAEGAMLIGGVTVAVLPKDSVTVDVTGRANVKVNTSSFGLDKGEISVKAGDVNIKLADIGDENIKITPDSNGVFHVDTDNKSLHFNLWDVLKLIGVAMIKVAALVVALFFLRALMKRFSLCDSPFCDEVVKAMRAFAIALIPTMAVSCAADAIFSGFFEGVFSFGGVDLVTVGFVLIIFMLTCIFKYGTKLQQQYDETV